MRPVLIDISRQQNGTAECRKLHNEEFNDLHPSPNIVRVIKIEKNEMGVACSAYGGEKRRIQGFWWGNLRERDHLGDPGVDGRIIFRLIFRKWDVRVGTGSSWLRLGTCECCNEHSGSINCEEFLD